MEGLFRRYPIGIQNFEQMRMDGYVFVDKTELVYRLANMNTTYFLSRPRRFGKSLLVSTLEAYIQGKKELFEGLAMERLEKEWKVYPVLHIKLMGQYVETEVKSAIDRSDIVVKLQDAIYVFEFKMDGTAAEALAQINSKGYAIPYQADHRRVVKVGVNFDRAARTVGEWIIEAEERSK